MEPTIEMKASKHPKITITPTRFSVKIPDTLTPEQCARVIAFAKQVVLAVGTPTQALRGAVRDKGYGPDPLTVSMHLNNGDCSGSYAEGKNP